MRWNFFTSAAGFLLLSLVLPLVTLARPQAAARNSRFNTDDLTKRHSGDIQKRFVNTRWTWYAVGL